MVEVIYPVDVTINSSVSSPVEFEEQYIKIVQGDKTLWMTNTINYSGTVTIPVTLEYDSTTKTLTCKDAVLVIIHWKTKKIPVGQTISYNMIVEAFGEEVIRYEGGYTSEGSPGRDSGTLIGNIPVNKHLPEIKSELLVIIPKVSKWDFGYKLYNKLKEITVLKDKIVEYPLYLYSVIPQERYTITITACGNNGKNYPVFQAGNNLEIRDLEKGFSDVDEITLNIDVIGNIQL